MTSSRRRLLSAMHLGGFGPDADQPWEWTTPGSLIGTLILLCVSLLFRVYVQNWADYSATYGSLAGVVILMSWLWI
jgi:membrane protein